MISDTSYSDYDKSITPNNHMIQYQQSISNFMIIISFYQASSLKGLPKIQYQDNSLWKCLSHNLLYNDSGQNQNLFRQYSQQILKKKHATKSKSLPWDQDLESEPHQSTPLMPSNKKWGKFQSSKMTREKIILSKIKNIRQANHFRRKTCFCLNCGLLSTKQKSAINLPNEIAMSQKIKTKGFAISSFNQLFIAKRKFRKDQTIILKKQLAQVSDDEETNGRVAPPPSAEIIKKKKKVLPVFESKYQQLYGQSIKQFQSVNVITPRRNGKIFQVCPISPTSPKSEINSNKYFLKSNKRKLKQTQEQFYSLQYFEQFQKSRQKVIQILQNDINQVRKRKVQEGQPKHNQTSPYLGKKLNFLLRLKTNQ